MRFLKSFDEHIFRFVVIVVRDYIFYQIKKKLRLEVVGNGRKLMLNNACFPNDFLTFSHYNTIKNNENIKKNHFFR